jgi:hypothetical protein
MRRFIKSAISAIVTFTIGVLVPIAWSHVFPQRVSLCMLEGDCVRSPLGHTFAPNVMGHKTRVMYIEYKGEDVVGPARIGRVRYSKTGKSIYYRGRRFDGPAMVE